MNVREQEAKIRKLEKEKRKLELQLTSEKKAQEQRKQTTIKLIGKHYNKFKKEIDDGETSGRCLSEDSKYNSNSYIQPTTANDQQEDLYESERCSTLMLSRTKLKSSDIKSK